MGFTEQIGCLTALGFQLLLHQTSLLEHMSCFHGLLLIDLQEKF